MSRFSHLTAGQLVPARLSENKSTSPVLQEFSRLDRSSQDFPKRFCDLLYGDEYTQCVPDLQDNDPMWLVEYLDQVWCHITLPTSNLTVDRFSTFSIPQVVFSESVYVSLEEYATLGE
jgi:hypothetical protein